MTWRKQHIKILFYKDGPDATVSVEKVDGIVAPAELGLRINGKPDAGTYVDVGINCCWRTCRCSPNRVRRTYLCWASVPA